MRYALYKTGYGYSLAYNFLLGKENNILIVFDNKLENVEINYIHSSVKISFIKFKNCIFNLSECEYKIPKGTILENCLIKYN